MSIQHLGGSTPTGCVSRIQKSNICTIQPLPSEKEMIASFFHSLEFFKKRENYHQEAATWYFNHARTMEAKANHHLDLAECAYSNRVHYLDLLVMAENKRMGVHTS